MLLPNNINLTNIIDVINMAGISRKKKLILLRPVLREKNAIFPDAVQIHLRAIIQPDPRNETAFFSSCQSCRESTNLSCKFAQP